MKKSLRLAFLIACAIAGAAHAEVPAGWSVTGSSPADYEIGSEVGARGPGDRSAFIRAKSDSTGFGTLVQMIDAEAYRGKRVRLSGFLRTGQAAKGQMWMRVDGSGNRSLAFDNMDDRPLVGDTPWKRYEIVLDVPESSIDVAFGFLLAGKGEIWADDFKLEIVGTDVPVTGGNLRRLSREPVNLDFSQ
jgi:hypothetical protein